MPPRRFGPLRPLALAGSVLVLTATLAGCTHPPVRSDQPSIVFILTDDQRWDTLWSMKTVQRDLVQHGVTFANAFVSDPLCCPSRATILTGQYAHSTGVWQNKGKYGGFQAFRQDRSTVATWLHVAGYRTALFGKYLNKYEGAYVPPGWDKWEAIAGEVDPYNLYYNYTLNVDGTLHKHGSKAGDYSTNVIANDAVSWIRHTQGSLFMYFAPYAPHTPEKPAPGDEKAFANLPPARPPSYNEPDISDKPEWARLMPPLTTAQEQAIDKQRRLMYASLLSVDRAVGAIVGALQATGRLHNTLIVFMSDNGYLWGEHRWNDKVVPYEESIRVPMVVRDDRVVSAPRVDQHLVVNLDIAPTFAAFAGVKAPGAQGLNFLPLLSSGSGPGPPWRTDFLIEHMNLLHVPSYCGIRSERYAYVHYATGEEELYDLQADPYELANRAGDSSLSAVLDGLRAREKTLCNPPPPVTAGAGGGPE